MAAKDMELTLGVNSQQALQEMAKAEAAVKRAAKASEAAFAEANPKIAKSFESMMLRMQRSTDRSVTVMGRFGKSMDDAGRSSGQFTSRLQNTSYQVQDIAVQIAGGTDASRALAQQLPQLLSGFGALGAILGTVAAVALPLAGSFLKTGDGAEELGKATDEAAAALDAYRAAAADANASSAELAARFGDAAGSARRLLEVIALSAQTEALVKQREVLASLNDRFEDLQNRVSAYQNVMAAGDAAGAMGWAVDIQEQYGLAVEEAIRLSEVINQLNTTTDQSKRNDLLVALVTILNDAASSGQDVNAEVAKLAGEAARAGLAVEEIGAAAAHSVPDMAALANEASALGDYLRDAAGAVASLQSAISGLSIGNIGRAAQLAALQAGQSKVDASIAGKVAEKQAELQTTFSPDDANFTGLQRELSQYEQTLREEARLTEQISALEKSLEPKPGGRGGKKRGGAGRSKREERPFFENIEKDAVAIQRQIELLGKSSEEVATARARWELLDEAKKRGIPVNEALNAQIDAQAAQVGRLTGELERAEISQQQFDQAIDGVADAMANALVAGESLREGLAQVFAQIASDILNSGIRNALDGQFGGGGLFNNLLGAFRRSNDPLGQALNAIPGFGGFRAAGGPVSPGEAYVVGERGPEIIVPRNAGHVIPNPKLGGGGTATFNINVTGTGNTEVMAAAEEGMARALKQYDRTLPNRVDAIQRDRLKRYS